MASSSDAVLSAVHCHVARLRLNRPERGNAVNLENLGALKAHLDEAIADDDVRAIVLEGQPGVFCRGLDFGYLLEQPSGEAIAEGFSAPYLAAVLALRDSPKPTIAAIDGEILAGGMGLAMACDVVLATERSVFGLSEVLFGLIPAYVFPFLLERVPLKRARYMVLSSRKFSAQEALGLGVVDELAPEGDLERRLTDLLKRVLYSSPEALALTKRYSDKIARMDIADASQEAAAQLTALLNEARNVEAIRAFLAGDKTPWAERYRRWRGAEG